MRARYLTGLAAALALLVLAPAAASAAESHVPLGFSPITGSGSGVTIHAPSGIAVDETSGNVFLDDGGEGNAIDILGAEGGTPADLVPPFQFTGFSFNGEPSGAAIDNSTTSPSRGDLYVTDVAASRVRKLVRNPVTEQYEEVGELVRGAGAFDEPLGAAVDSQGNVYIANYSPAEVIKFSPAGVELGSLDTGSSVGSPSSIALDHAGDLFIQSYGGGAVVEYPVNGSGEFESGVFTQILESGATGVAVDTGADRLYVALGESVNQYDAATLALQGSFGVGTLTSTTRVAVNSGTGRIYVSDNGFGKENIAVFGPPVFIPDVTTGPATDVEPTSAQLNGQVDLGGGGDITDCQFEYGETTEYSSGTKPCTPEATAGAPFTGPTDVSASISGLTVNTTYHYRLTATDANGTSYGSDRTLTPLAVKDLATLPATDITPHGVTLNGTFDPNGVATRYYFEYGGSIGYGSYAPVPPPGESGGEGFGDQTVSAAISGLEAGVTYNYRLVATNIFGTALGANMTVVPSGAPSVTSDAATLVNTDGATLRAQINPNALATSYHFEYGPEDCSIATCEMGPSVEIGAGKANVPVSLSLAGLSPGSTNHFRVVATNSAGTATTSDHSFKTFPLESGLESCPNLLVRKQTGAGAAPRCRAYELVSAVDSGGFDVESNLIPGLTPMEGYPRADGKVLYTVHFGSIPGSGQPTNRGGDPYLATRGENGWSTEYVGLQADDTPSTLPFSSTLAEADEGLDSFAFAGSELCEPCFADGSTNVPLRLPDGRLVKGMAGSLDPGPADPAGQIEKRFSSDGSHFVFGSTARFEPAGNSGSLSIYDRRLSAGTTQVVSTLPDGSTMTGEGIAELDISADGSRILIGKLISTDAAGNQHWHLYMHVGDSPDSIDLTPGTTTGALYAGMNDAGTRVYFTTADQLAGGDDLDSGPDLYSAEVGPSAAVVSRISVGGDPDGNTDACDPSANADGNNWNAFGPASADDCGVVAIAGGGGVAAADGSVYFLSPEKLDGAANGTLDQPNLYLAVPGAAPRYVATLEPDNPLIRHAVSDSGTRDTADFQVTPAGRYAVFATDIPLTGASSGGHVEIFRYDAAPGGGLACVSCAPTNGVPSTDTGLTSGGLNLTDDGRVLFTSSEQLVLRDTNQLKDVYEWADNSTGLVSTGLDTNDSGLLSASADGRDAYFFTRQSLAPQDENGGAMKIYDAREEGGFLYNPPPHPCVASDECHGAGTQAPSPPPISTVRGTGEPQPTQPATKRTARNCRQGFARKHGRCVKKHRRHKRQSHRHPTRRHG